MSDFWGNKLKLGDEVALNNNGRLISGIVIGLTPKKVKIYSVIFAKPSVLCKYPRNVIKREAVFKWRPSCE